MDNKEIFKQLSETMANRGGPYPGMDIPEFYPMVEEMFTPEEAALSNAMPIGHFTLDKLLPKVDMSEEELIEMLKEMGKKGLSETRMIGGKLHYMGSPFMPGIIERKFMRGTFTDHDKRVAILVKKYVDRVDEIIGERVKTYPEGRVIPINQTVKGETTVRVYDEIMSYIDKNDFISVGTCYCRHWARLVDENDVCEKPHEVCMIFGEGARNMVENGIGRSLTKEEAREVILETEKEGLIHCTMNTKDITFVCNCCKCHCMGIEMALRNDNPSDFISSGFKPVTNQELCVNCGTCIDICPTEALSFNSDDILEINSPKCLGCGLCVSNCEVDALTLSKKEDAYEPAEDIEDLMGKIAASVSEA
ncbi:MAG: 4Fe-4S binding protein [Desulfobacterales bacterium]|jgi:Na+-translocating ferredoxin:NAD+ oxidoreductase subunit B|nr:4Fe-4S binding protein [Desulfobacteraceae bacterium]MBT4362948.1 4Fe-4S binding protein [Desulfobacteraceae bacterium]MBT7086441.1 4Fe-4S binding protein [Desulfobacterales bacterium]MBT7697879.1 4Fe-4S binding protein [Desulfobacterales bacterium]